MSHVSQKHVLARKRWRLLGQVIRRRHCPRAELSTISVRRFSSYGLLATDVLDREEETDAVWYNYTCPRLETNAATIRHLSDGVKLDDLFGFNNTGNVCVWPSEEVMAYYCLKQPNIFRDASVCEVGGGMTCLAGVLLSICAEAKHIHLTDGNEQSVTNLKFILERNKDKFGDTKVTTGELRWDDPNHLKSLEEKFDLIICADCMFFDEYRDDLLNVICTILKPQGQALMFAPSRSQSFHKFAKLAEETLKVETQERYDDLVWSLHTQMLDKGLDSYDANLHYPLFMKVTIPS